MVFSSIIFLLYFAPIFFLIYFLLPDKLKNPWILITSTLFYFWGAPTFISILLLSCITDYVFSNLFIKKQNLLFYYIAISCNVALLLYFKYFNFFIDNFSILTGISLNYSKVLLPIGISFLTFQKISYLVDIRRSNGELQPKFHNYLLYVILFPQLIAGPIVRFKEISSQITQRYNEINTTNIYIGLKRFIIGLSKKVLIANVLGESVDQLFSLEAGQINTYGAILGMLGYSFQIYFDFSGYSDMAIGLGKMMGFDFPENFNFPYISNNITEFWRRWHITLSSWMRDYLYIPLGGNKKSNLRTYINLIIVFLISGFWHGASWNFIVWGGYHGFFLVIERLFLIKLYKKIPTIFKVILTFLIVSIGWLLFRVDSINDFYLYTSSFNNIDIVMANWKDIFHLKFYTILVLATLFSFSGYLLENKLNNVLIKPEQKTFKLLSSFLLILVLFILSLGELLASGFNPFIYFKF